LGGKFFEQIEGKNGTDQGALKERRERGNGNRRNKESVPKKNQSKE
jgi:hypothetical protein